MYIWIGCKLPEDFQQEIRRHCLALNEGIGLDTVAFDLPQHISLKISFPTDRPQAVLEELSAYLSDQQPFPVHILNAERMGSILWLPTAENETLDRLHRELDQLLECKFSVPQHPFDKCFQFHSTLFIDPDAEKIIKMEKALDHCHFARSLTVDTFLLGVSETGKPGSYRIVRPIKV